MKCIFNEAYSGTCGKETSEEYTSYCNEHKGIECSYNNCDNQAVRECIHTGGLVCGKPISNNHDSSLCQKHNTSRSLGFSM